MPRSLLSLHAVRRHPEWGALPLRAFLGLVLVWGTQDNVLSRARMLEFSEFLAHNQFPVPLFSAYLSAYAQFVCGILILVGAFTRFASLVMVVNFAVALAMVHVGLPFQDNIAPLAMFFASAALLFVGAGPVSVDSALERRAARPHAAAPTAAPARPVG